mmetsp:Transcript_28129/g.63433  ORF Transcript_28129/g.63433 Transcript_28129/m.63433 type:complete len:85 (-) Transcript_28129:740-994(-)
MGPGTGTGGGAGRPPADLDPHREAFVKLPPLELDRAGGLYLPTPGLARPRTNMPSIVLRGSRLNFGMLVWTRAEILQAAASAPS